MSTPFVHLHVHSQYSLLDGQASISAMVEKAIATGMPGLALTDHGNMFGIKEFYNYIKKRNGKTKDAIAKLEEQVKTLDENGVEYAANRQEVTKLKSQLIKPIFGCEVYVAQEDLHTQVDKNDRGRHLIVLAKNKTGYKNLIKIVSQAWTEGFYTHPRTDKASLAAHREGLIVASACLGGEIPKLIANGDIAEAEAAVKWWKDTFGEDYYIELQRHPTNKPGGNREVYELQQIVNPELKRIADKFDIKVIATNDSHFVNEEDAEAHDRLICISTGKNVADEKRMHYTKQEWLKTPEEMAALFSDIPEALANTIDIYNKVEEYGIDHGPIMPNFEIPAEFGSEEEYRQRLTEQDLFDEFTRDELGNVVLSEDKAKDKIAKLGGYDKLYRIKFEADYLRKLAYEGAAKRYGTPLPAEIDERINFELHIMKTMGFPGYFLIVQDFINTARNKLGVSVGPGRGSAAGSCVAYCLGITQIDPVKYDLLFERFLNPDRISLPDIDIDFDDDGRADVLRYVTHKYGEEKVAHIITYGTMATKMAIKDVARVEGLSVGESDRLTKLVPRHMPVVDGKELKLNLGNCLKYVPEFQNEINGTNPDIKRTLEFARQLEGNIRNTGVHACGVIICRDDITDWVPVSTAVDKSTDSESTGKVIVTQYEGSVIEETGLIKMDFLGLKTLSIIKEAVANIKRTRGIDVDPDTIPIDDPKTYQLYCEGRTTGTFQFESAGMQKYLRELQPSTFEDLIAMNALYRPGPMDYIPDFISRKHGRTPVTYDIPVMEKYLKDTYGVTVYQEQVMLLSRLLANFTRGESDTLRKAMGKKLIDKMQALKTKFLAGGQANGHEAKTLEKIWADWEKFASYAFNKSHATCYSWVAFQTAYLKANYPAEFMAAVLTRNSGDITKLTEYMEEARKMHVRILGPDVNESYYEFGVNSKGNIRFGLKAIKGVGDNLVNDLLAARDKEGPFKSVYDFVERMPTGSLNRRNLESLALAGAFDCFAPDIKREDFMYANPKGDTFSEALLRYGQLFQNDKMNKGCSLFGDDDSMNTAGRPPVIPAPRWPSVKLLEEERNLVGLYLSGHPLDPYYIDLTYGCTQLKDFSEDANGIDAEGQTVLLGGMVTASEKATNRKGDPFMRLKLEDFTGSHTFALFGNNYYNYQSYCETGTKILITAGWQRMFRNGDLRFTITNIRTLDSIKDKLTGTLEITLTPGDMNDTLLGLLQDATATVPGQEHKSSLAIKLYDPESRRNVRMTAQRNLTLNRKLLDSLKELDVEFCILPQQ